MKSLEETYLQSKNVKTNSNCFNDQYSNYNNSKISKKEKADLENSRHTKSYYCAVGGMLEELSKNCNFYYWTITFEDADLSEFSKQDIQQSLRKYPRSLRTLINSRLKINKNTKLTDICLLVNREKSGHYSRKKYIATDHLHIIVAIPKHLDDRFMQRCITGTEPKSYICRKTSQNKTVESCLAHQKFLKIPSNGLKVRGYLLTAVKDWREALKIASYNNKAININNIDKLDEYFEII